MSKEDYLSLQIETLIDLIKASIKGENTRFFIDDTEYIIKPSVVRKSIEPLISTHFKQKEILNTLKDEGEIQKKVVIG